MTTERPIRSYGLYDLDHLEALLKAATPGPWIENGTLIGPTLNECDASTDEDEPINWVTFKTERPDADRKLWIELTQALPALAERVRKLEEDVEQAWGILANVSNGDWTQQTQEWQNAVITWRDARYIGSEDEK